ncbi:MAG: hypothetical protein ACRDZ5_11440, partial [Acidimicrobiales bacterium]
LLQPRAPGRRTARRRRVVAWVALGLAVGGAIGSLQWGPAAAFIAVSQRAHPAYSFLAGGSLSPAQFLLDFVPHLLGGGPIGLMRYAGSYQLSEMDAAPGIVALLAAAVLAWRWRRPEAWRWRVFLVVGILGVLVALGSNTPLEHVLAALPVTGRERLPSRALISVALSFSVLLGYFLDELQDMPARRHAQGGPAHAPSRAHRRRSDSELAGSARRGGLTARELLPGLAPVAVVLGIAAATAASARPAGGALEPVRGLSWSPGAVAPALALSSGLALAAAGLILAARRLGPARLARTLGALAVVGIVIFDFNQSSLAPLPVSVLSAHSSEQAALAALAGDGRVLIADPRLAGGPATDRVGGPDLGVLSRTLEAGGYGSISWGPYAAATGTKPQDAVSRSAVLEGTLARLGVRVLLALPADLGPGGSLAGISSSPRWRPAGHIGPFVALVERAAPRFSVVGAGGKVGGLSSSVWTGDATVAVASNTPGLLVRSMAAIPGWTAEVVHDGRATGVRVERYGPGGLVQAVRIPAGRSFVSFSYVPPGWRASQLASLGGAVVALVLAVAGFGPLRRGGLSGGGAGSRPRG